MRSIFRFFRSGHEALLDAEFRRTYQAPGARFLGIGLAFYVFIFGTFYLLDALNDVLPMFGGVQTFRLVVCVFSAFGSAFCLAQRAFVTRHYTVIMNIVVLGALEAAAYTGYFSRKHLSEAELYWVFRRRCVPASSSSMASAV